MNEKIEEELYQFHLLLSNLARSIRRKYRRWMAQNGFKHYYFRLLHHVDQDNPPKLSDLSKRSITKKSNITKMIKTLISEGYIKKEDDPNDQRIKRVKITAKGLEKREEMIRAERNFVQDAYKNVPASKVPEYINMVKEVRGFLEENLRRDNDGRE
ncbi:MAG: MarR family winged helix-turn-helix transcriptional regulator [Candidatus Hodarchaeota archaeon]